MGQTMECTICLHPLVCLKIRMSLVKQSILERKTDCFPYQNSLLNNGEKFDVLQNN